jgi:hypothetical protein
MLVVGRLLAPTVAPLVPYSVMTTRPGEPLPPAAFAAMLEVAAPLPPEP